MLNSITIGSATGPALFLFPGDLVCGYVGIDQNDKRELVRMLVNSLVWIVIGMACRRHRGVTNARCRIPPSPIACRRTPSRVWSTNFMHGFASTRRWARCSRAPFPATGDRIWQPCGISGRR